MKKTYAFFKGCKLTAQLDQYGASTRAVLKAFDIELADLMFNCCGYPQRDLDFSAYILLAARNLAIVRENGVDLMTPCKCCFGSLKHADHFLTENPGLRRRVNQTLAAEGLKWEEGVRIKHFLTVLAEDVGRKTIESSIQKPYKGLKIAAHYGCHALRPGNITGFDNPLAPSIFENLVEATGAKCVDWDMRLQCCGNPLYGKNTRLSLDLMQKKLESARKAGADYLCSACTYCQIQFDQLQQKELLSGDHGSAFPSILYSQLLGVSLDLPEKQVGLNLNHIDVSGVRKFIGEPQGTRECRIQNRLVSDCA